MASSVVPPNQLPSARLASFQNQTVGALNAGLPADAAAPLSPTQVALGNAAKKQTAVQLSAQSRISSIQDRNNQLSKLAQQTLQAKKAQQQAALRGGPGSSVGMGSSRGSIASAGKAYSPDGKLSASRNAALAEASSYLGDRYVLGGSSHKGIDCSGLVMMVYNKMVGGLGSHYVPTQMKNVPGVRTSVNNLRPGDLVVWNNGSHIAIYAGNGQIIEAANPKAGVRKHNIWSKDVTGIALRLPGE